MRSFSLRRFVAITICLIPMTLLAGCDVEIIGPDGKVVRSSATQNRSTPSTTALPPAAAGDTISIATFNIQVFGTSKLKKPAVMDTLARVVRKFDVVAVQEVRSSDPTVVPQLVDLINADGSTYTHVIGPRLGRTASKEQYTFIYNAGRIEHDPSWLYTLPDPSDQMHREPLAARFHTRTAPGTTPFSFTLVNIHTDPDETEQELNALDDVFVAVEHDGSGEDDVVILGDLNVDEYHLGELGQLPGIAHVVAGVPTNTRGTKTYDNMVYDRRATAEYTGQWGVLDLRGEFGLSESEALDVSDHQPVWAIFTATEQNAGAPIATLPGGRTR
jgi:endonuclease/exonuclease/phosphatase family metal-dependent hydrolase